MQDEGTLLLRRKDVAELLTLEECIGAVEAVFRLQGGGKVPAPGILGVKATRGGLHVKAGLLPGERNYLVAKLNTNFPGNAHQFCLPSIQGVIVICDAENGRPLAVFDSIDITIKRTAAASAVAAKYLARPDSVSAPSAAAASKAARNYAPCVPFFHWKKSMLSIETNRSREIWLKSLRKN